MTLIMLQNFHHFLSWCDDELLFLSKPSNCIQPAINASQDHASSVSQRSYFVCMRLKCHGITLNHASEPDSTISWAGVVASYFLSQSRVSVFSRLSMPRRTILPGVSQRSHFVCMRLKCHGINDWSKASKRVLSPLTISCATSRAATFIVFSVYGQSVTHYRNFEERPVIILFPYERLDSLTCRC